MHFYQNYSFNTSSKDALYKLLNIQTLPSLSIVCSNGHNLFVGALLGRASNSLLQLANQLLFLNL